MREEEEEEAWPGEWWREGGRCRRMVESLLRAWVLLVRASWLLEKKNGKKQRE